MSLHTPPSHRPLRRAAAVAGVVSAIIAALQGAPAATAADPPNPPVIKGDSNVGSSLVGSVDPASFRGCGQGAGPDFRTQWKRNGEDVYPPDQSGRFPLTLDDLGAQFTLSVEGNFSCWGQELTSAPTAPVGASIRNSGFTGRGTAELMARTADGTLLLYPRNTGWEPPQTVGPGWNTMDIILSPGDFNGDGTNDLLARAGDGTLYLYPGLGSNRFDAPSAVGWGWNRFDAILGVGDFSGDGVNDVLAREPGGDLYLYRGNGAGGWTGQPERVGTGWNSLSALTTPGNLDGTPGRDVVGRDAAGNLWLYSGNGSGGWSGSRVIGQGWGAMKAIGGAGDFNRDGYADIYAVDGNGVLWVYYGDGSGGLGSAERIGEGWGGFTAIF